MKKITIKLETEVDDIGDLTPSQLRYLLADAFAEFQHPRRDAEAYIEKRYAPAEDYAWMNRENKVREVQTRTRLAEHLRCAALQCEPEVVDIKEDGDDHP